MWKNNPCKMQLAWWPDKPYTLACRGLSITLLSSEIILRKYIVFYPYGGFFPSYNRDCFIYVYIYIYTVSLSTNHVSLNELCSCASTVAWVGPEGRYSGESGSDSAFTALLFDVCSKLRYVAPSIATSETMPPRVTVPSGPIGPHPVMCGFGVSGQI